MHRYLVDPKQVYAEHVNGRHVVYLDTNAWSDLSKGASREACEARTLATSAQAARRAVFPLSFATITEFLKRAVTYDASEEAKLMDELSSGVTLRGGRHIHDLEVMRVYDFLIAGHALTRTNELFTVTACHISDGRIVFPDGWTETDADEFMTQLRARGNPGAQWLQRHLRTPEFLRLHATTDEKYVRDITRKRTEAATWASDRSGRLNANAIRLEEHTFALNSYIIAHLPRVVGVSGVMRVAERLASMVQEPNAAALCQLVEQMPSIALSCEMNVQRVLLNARHTKEQDFYDHEHAAFGVPYSDAFVTSDSGLLDILRRSGAPGPYACRILRGMANLVEYLRSILVG